MWKTEINQIHKIPGVPIVGMLAGDYDDSRIAFRYMKGKKIERVHLPSVNCERVSLCVGTTRILIRNNSSD